MAQNIYDSAEFFQQYSKLPRSVHGLDGAAEWPTMKRLLGSVENQDVLDLGCGMGWFCRFARGQGARSILGVDISETMLDKARSFDSSESDTIAGIQIAYERKDLETPSLQPEAYDLVYSSLTFHYLPSLRDVFGSVYQSLRPNGRFLFSVEHPVMTAPKGGAFNGAYKRDETSAVIWPLNSYSIEGLRETEWLETKGVRKYHHMVETYLTTLIDIGFTLTAMRESWDGMNRNPLPDEEDWGGHKPFLLIVSATKKSDSIGDSMQSR